MKPILIECFADNGQHSCWSVIDSDTGKTIINDILSPCDMTIAFAKTIDMYTELHAKAWASTPEECKELLTMRFPLIQTMKIQSAIKEVGKLPYDKNKAAEQIIKAAQQMVAADA